MSESTSEETVRGIADGMYRFLRDQYQDERYIPPSSDSYRYTVRAAIERGVAQGMREREEKP